MAGRAALASSVMEMLKADHEKVIGLFAQFERTEGQVREDIAATAVMELEVHADLEERLIYPTIREHLDEDDRINEAVEEHHVIHLLIKELKALNPKMRRFRPSSGYWANWSSVILKKKREGFFPRRPRSRLAGRRWGPR